MKNKLFGLLIIIVLLGGAAFIAWPRPEAAVQAQLSAVKVQDGNFQRADGKYQLHFPADFGPHNDYQSEWWYYTGNLSSADGRHFGYELTFFRRAIQSPDKRVPRTSDWAAEQVYMAHLTLTDVSGQHFRYDERFSRGSAGLAGASIDPVYRVWLNDWSVQAVSANTYHLLARTEDFALDFILKDQKRPVLQGVQGYSVKGPEPGNASYYYSQTRLNTEGTIQIGNENFTVQGSSWKDHEFSTSALGADLVGWDWFSLQLSDGSELMLYNLRRKDGSIDAYSSGTLIYQDGTTRLLKRDDFVITSTKTWRSPRSGATYPASWTVSIPSEQISLQINPYLADQELNVSFVYWEGAVQVTGTKNGKAIEGHGYIELTGYSKSIQGEI